MITKIKKSHKKIFKKNNSSNRNKLKKVTLKRRIKKSDSLKKSKKNQSGGALAAITPDIQTITNLVGRTIPNLGIQGLSTTSKVVDMLARQFSQNALSEILKIRDLASFIPPIINNLVNNFISPAYQVVKETVSFRLIGRLSSSQLASLGLIAGVGVLSLVYLYGQMTDQQLLIDKKKEGWHRF